MIYVVNTNTNNCKIYHYEKNPARLTLLKEINHPEIKLKKSDYLTSDKPGRYKNDAAGGGAYQQRTDPKEVEIDNFSRDIARELDQGRTKNNFEKLILIAPSHMTGLLFQHLNKHVKELVINNIQKDLQHLKDHELLEYLQVNAQYPD
ncbi:MAG: host attachment protein [Gammaproteobacteria bacterium]